MHRAGVEDTGELPRLGATDLRVVVFVPGHDLKLELRRAILHCDQCGHEIAAVCVGERSWPSAKSMLDLGEVCRIVTAGRSPHASERGVEVAGAGRTTIRTPARATRLRQIADLVDSGLSIAEVVRILRG